MQAALPYDRLRDLNFSILKSQQGNDGFDPWFERNMRAGFDAGHEVFAYAFVYPLPGNVSGRDPLEQAKLFVDRIHRFPEMRDRPIFLDFEWPEVGDWAKRSCNATQISEWSSKCCEEVTDLSGRRPVIYTYPWWWKCVSAADVSWAKRYPLWLAAYLNGRWPNPGENPKVPAPWSDWLFWQQDGNGGLLLPNGVDSDFCVFNGDLAALKAFSKGPQPELRDFDIVHPRVIN